MKIIIKIIKYSKQLYFFPIKRLQLQNLEIEIGEKCRVFNRCINKNKVQKNNIEKKLFRLKFSLVQQFSLSMFYYLAMNTVKGFSKGAMSPFL